MELISEYIVLIEIIRYIRFGHGDLNLWEIVAIELEVTVDFKSTINYRQMVLTGSKFHKLNY